MNINNSLKQAYTQYILYSRSQHIKYQINEYDYNYYHYYDI